jgi:6-phosphogluconolactonase
MTVKTIMEKNYSALSKKIADAIIKEAKSKPGRILIGLCGGTSVGEIYSRLSKSRGEFWKRVEMMLADERVVPNDSDESNYRFCVESLKNPDSKKTISTIHPVYGQEKTPRKMASDYTKKFESLGGKFDILILSSGEEGHVGALFPDRKELDREGYVFLDDSPKPPNNRITLTPKMIREAGAVFLMFKGESKRDAYKMFLDKAIKSRSLPAKFTLDSGKLVIGTNLEAQ